MYIIYLFVIVFVCVCIKAFARSCMYTSIFDLTRRSFHVCLQHSLAFVLNS